MDILRVLGKLEPGGAQLSVLRLSRELQRRYAVRTTLLVGDASREGLRLADRFGISTLAYRVADQIHPIRNLQWDQSGRFADWLADKLTGADVVHAHMVGAWWATGQVIDAATPFAATEHNEVNWNPRRTRGLRSVAARVDQFYAMGPSAHRFALAAGVRPEVIQPARSPIEGMNSAPRLGLRSPRLTFSGRFNRDKGPDVLVEALLALARPELFCCLLGDGPLRAGLSALVERAGLTDRISMPGWIDDPWRYVAGSTVHVVPSREEAWSQSAVLALGMGVPVIGTAVDGLVDTLAQSRGILIPPDDPQALGRAIAAVLDGAAETDRRGAAAYARTFRLEHVANFYEQRYRALASARSVASLPLMAK